MQMAISRELGKEDGMGFPPWLCGLRTHLVSMRMQKQCLASLSGLSIWHCCKLRHRSQRQLGSQGCSSRGVDQQL